MPISWNICVDDFNCHADVQEEKACELHLLFQTITLLNASPSHLHIKVSFRSIKHWFNRLSSTPIRGLAWDGKWWFDDDLSWPHQIKLRRVFKHIRCILLCHKTLKIVVVYCAQQEARHEYNMTRKQVGVLVDGINHILVVQTEHEMTRNVGIKNDFWRTKATLRQIVKLCGILHSDNTITGKYPNKGLLSYWLTVPCSKKDKTNLFWMHII